MDRLDLTPTDALVQTSFLVQGILEARASERGFSLIQARLLGILRDREPTMNELAKLLGLDKSSVSGLVDRAQRRGLVARRPSETDGRSVRVVLSERGRGDVEAFAARFEADMTAVLAPLSGSEQTELTGRLDQLLRAHAEARGIDLSGAGVED